MTRTFNPHPRPARPQLPPFAAPDTSSPARPPAPARSRARRRSPAPNSAPAGRRYIVGGVMLALVGFIADPSDWVKANQADPNLCQTVVEAGALLSRAELGQLLNVPERSTTEQVRQIVSTPYCELPSVEIRPGIQAQREAYPLEFDPDTWLILLYEEGEYAGYDFTFRS